MKAMTTHSLRIVALALGLSLAAAGSALAQGNTTIFSSTTPVGVGDTVRGMVLYPMGTTGIATVKVTGYYPDDMTTYWAGYEWRPGRGLNDAGTRLGKELVYDPYSGFWKPSPVSYQESTLQFQDKTIEGWVRTFGDRMDRNLFIGRDGDVYRRVNITRKIRRGKRSRVRVVYTYFLDLRTLERSDGREASYYGMNAQDQDYIKQQSALQEAALAQKAAADPAFPQWQLQKGQNPSPEVVSVPAEPTEAQDKSLAELIQEQENPNTVGPVVPGAK
jgi:hypothetical protein